MRGSYLHSELHYTIFRLAGIYTFIKCHQNLQNVHKSEIVGMLSNTDRKLSKFQHISFFVDGTNLLQWYIYYVFCARSAWKTHGFLVSVRIFEI
jgi:hypothetical protein